MTEPDDTGSSVLDREAALRADASTAALDRYRRRMRRQRAIYYPIVGAVVLALVIAFTVAYLHGEAHNTRSITVAAAPAKLPVAAPAPAQHRVWQTSDRAALGNPVRGGTVVVWGKHTVRGVNARTGAQTWSYYRSDRTVCSAIQMNGIAVAVYELAGNCDELTGLSVATGVRKWTRTLDLNGQPLFGQPTYQIDVPDQTLLITTATVIYAVGVGTSLKGADGEDRFEYSHFGCHINSAALGFQGALISQTCTKPRCAGLSFCGKGPQLLLRGQPSTNVDSSDTKNPNLIVWNELGDTDVPISAGDVVAAGNRSTGELDLLGSTTGKPRGSLDLGVSGSAWSGQTSALELSNGDLLVWAGDHVSAIRPGSSDPLWSATSPGPPVVNGNTVVLPSTGGARLVAPGTGKTLQRSSLTPAQPTGSMLYRLGSGYLAASTSGTAAYS